MARLLGPAPDSWVYTLVGSTFSSAAGLIATVYAAQTGSTLADIAAYQPGAPSTPGAVIAGSTLTVDANSLLPLFWFPDGQTTVYVSVGGGPRTPVYANYNPRIDTKVGKGDLVFNVRDYGAVGDGVTNDKVALAACFAAATAVKGQVFLPPGTYAVDGTLPLSGYSCSIIGSGSSYVTSGGARPVGTVIKAINQTGPVLDFAGFVWPANYMARMRIEGFAVQGDNTAGTAKKGIAFTTGFPIALAIRDIAVTTTGGIGFDAGDMYLSIIDGLVVSTPVSSVTNDVPYVQLRGCNGNIFTGLGLRSTITGGVADVPASGALRIEASSFASHDQLFNGMWLENFHIGDGNAIIVTQCSGTVFSDTQVFDTFKVTGAANTSVFRLEAPAASDFGGNIIRGLIPGRGTTATDYDHGVRLAQSNNRVEGVRGYRGHNVLLDSGVTGCTVFLGGSYAGPTDAAWTDNSASTTNTLIDTSQGVWQLGANTGSSQLIQAGAVRRAGTGTPEGAVVGNIGDQYIRTDGGPGFALYTKGLFNASNAGWHAHPVELLSAATLAGVSQAIPFSSAPAFLYTLTANQTFTSISNPRTGSRLTVMLKQDATGGRTVTWPSTVKWTANTAPTLSTAANAVDVFVFMFDGTNWREMSRSLGQT